MRIRVDGAESVVSAAGVLAAGAGLISYLGRGVKAAGWTGAAATSGAVGLTGLTISAGGAFALGFGEIVPALTGSKSFQRKEAFQMFWVTAGSIYLTVKAFQVTNRCAQNAFKSLTS